MENKKFKVKVEWQGVKKNNLPSGLQYITVSKFDETWMQNAWSVVLEFEIPPNMQGNPSVGFARFLVPSAPKEKLFHGASFELYEGNTLTAKAAVI